MVSTTFFRKIRKGLFIVLPLALIASYSVHEASGYVYGVTGGSTSGCSSGGGCHGSKSSATVIKIYTAAPQIHAGQTYVFSISVANPSEQAAGCDISTSSGGKLALNGSSSNMQAYSGELTHTQANLFTGDSAVWTFKYTAPKTVGTAHIYAAGNAVNDNGYADAGDHWNTIVYNVNVVSAAGVQPGDNVASDVSVYPNPSRGQITLGATGLSGDAIAQVSDATGRIVHTESVTLSNETPLDLSALTNGPYFLSVRTRDGQSFTRNIVINK